MMRDGAEGVISRGKAERRQNHVRRLATGGRIFTSVLRAKLSVQAALEAASQQAEAAAQSTITMQARKGRASYLGERSIGHQDPGATSVMFMMQMLAQASRE